MDLCSPEEVFQKTKRKRVEGLSAPTTGSLEKHMEDMVRAVNALNKIVRENNNTKREIKEVTRTMKRIAEKMSQDKIKRAVREIDEKRSDNGGKNTTTGTQTEN